MLTTALKMSKENYLFLRVEYKVQGELSVSKQQEHLEKCNCLITAYYFTVRD
jgi:hypothetical protein